MAFEKNWVLGILMVLLLGSCVGKRNVNYLSDRSLSTGSSKLFENRKFEYRIQSNDVLSIRVLGLDEATSRFFNVESAGAAVGMNESSLYVNGFSVDKNGQVQLPTVGKVKIQGLTVGEAQELLQRKINEYFTTLNSTSASRSFRRNALMLVTLRPL